MRPFSVRVLVAVAASVLLAMTACAAEEETVTPEATPGPPSTVVAFKADAKEFTEGVAVDSRGNVFVSITSQGRVMRILDGTNRAADFGKVDGLRPDDLGLLGLTTDTDGNVYGGVVSKNPAANGVWRFDAESGDETRVKGTEKIPFANAVVVDGDTIYVTDTTGPGGKGAVWRVPEDGTAQIWAQGGLLAGNSSLRFGFPLGANGIDVRDDTVYVGITETAKIVAIPIEEDGSAGEVTLFADLTKAAPGGKLAAVDGIDIDDDGNVYVAAPLVHLVLKVSSDGKNISTVADADDNLDGPASVALGEDAVYIANFSASLGPTSNKKGPSIVRVPV